MPASFGSFRPLFAVKFFRVECVGRLVGVRPVLVDKRGHIEMDEHAEAVVDKLLLHLGQIVRPGAET